MRIQKHMEAVDELAVFMNLNLSNCSVFNGRNPLPPALRGEALVHELRFKNSVNNERAELYIGKFTLRRTIGIHGSEAILVTQIEHGKMSKPLSAKQFARAFSNLRRFQWWSGGHDLNEQIARGITGSGAVVLIVQQALNFILDPLVTAKNSNDVEIGIERVMEFLNNDSWFVCDSSARENAYRLVEYWGNVPSVEEQLPPMTWRMERVVGDANPTRWEFVPFSTGDELYPVAMTVLAQAATDGDLINLRRCTLDECGRFFVVKKQPGVRANFCTGKCRTRHYNIARITENRIETKYKRMRSLAKKKIPLNEGEIREVEKYMKMEEFEQFRAHLSAGNPWPRLSDEINSRFAVPRPRRTRRRLYKSPR